MHTAFPRKSNLSFKRSLRKSEINDYTKTLNAAKQKAGQTGKSIFIVHDACLPQSASANTGMGNLSSKDASKFFDMIKTYLGVNMVEVLPQGPISSKSGFYCAYGSSALPLGEHQINPELLLEKRFENLITQKEYKAIVDSNNIPDKDSRVNYANIFKSDTVFDNVLKKAHKRFQNLDESNDLKKKYKVFVQENKDWMEPVANAMPGVEDEFFKFKQFLADEHLKIAKEMLNKKGLKLCGDCEIGFSKYETAAFPKAFFKDTYIGLPEWKLPALNYDTILNPESESYKLLKRKVQLAAKRYDTIRFDVSWAYVTPLLTPKGQNSYRRDLGDSLIKQIESWVKEVKGPDFNLQDLLHEFEAGKDEFRAFVNDRELIEPLKGRTKVYSATHLDNRWATNDAFINYRNFSPDEYVLGVGNHDPQPLRQIAENIPDYVKENGRIVEKRYKWQQIEPLSRIFGISKELLVDPVEFCKAKFAEPMMAKNNMVFYMDVFGRKDRFDMQEKNNPMAYSNKIPADFEKAYIKSVQEGFGFNIMDSLEKVFKAKGLDTTEPELYRKIIKYRNILIEKEPSNLAAKKLIIAACAALTAAAAVTAVLKSKNISLLQKSNA